MLELWVGFADNPASQHRADDIELRGRTPQRAFEDSRLFGTLNARKVEWMLLIDPTTEPGTLMASYGVPPQPLLPPGPLFCVSDNVEQWPAKRLGGSPGLSSAAPGPGAPSTMPRDRLMTDIEAALFTAVAILGRALLKAGGNQAEILAELQAAQTQLETKGRYEAAILGWLSAMLSGPVAPRKE